MKNEDFPKLDEFSNPVQAQEATSKNSSTAGLLKLSHPPDEIVLQSHNLSVNYGKTPVLWDVSLQIPNGHVIGILGPNGAGKTTFIKTALGLLKPISGKVEFFGEPLKKVRQRIAYVPQRETVDWDFPITVHDLVLMGRYGQLGFFRWPRQADVAAVNEYLEMVGMNEYADRQISQLSGGQQQRVFLARALIQNADLYFMDEPFIGIDLTSKSVIISLLHKLKEQGKTVFVVHHELGNVESYFDWVIMLNIRLVACGNIKDVFNQENLVSTYGKSYNLFDTALKLSQQKTRGLS
jgi:manganese/zinc/iron transport system ATP- binding protein